MGKRYQKRVKSILGKGWVCKATMWMQYEREMTKEEYKIRMGAASS